MLPCQSTMIDALRSCLTWGTLLRCWLRDLQFGSRCSTECRVARHTQHWDKKRARSVQTAVLVATPGALAEVLSPPQPQPVLAAARFLVIDEVDACLAVRQHAPYR